MDEKYALNSVTTCQVWKRCLLSQKSGHRDKEGGTVSSKSEHKNRVHPMKTEPVHKGLLCET